MRWVPQGGATAALFLIKIEHIHSVSPEVLTGLRQGGSTSGKLFI
jgi:hypothetical protein